MCCEDEWRKRKETKVINHFPHHFLCVSCWASFICLSVQRAECRIFGLKKKRIFCFSYTHSRSSAAAHFPPFTMNMSSDSTGRELFFVLLLVDECWSCEGEDEEKLFNNNNNIHPTRIDITRENVCGKAKLEREEIHFLLLHFSGFIYIRDHDLRCCAAGKKVFKFVCNSRQPPPAPELRHSIRHAFLFYILHASFFEMWKRIRIIVITFSRFFVHIAS